MDESISSLTELHAALEKFGELWADDPSTWTANEKNLFEMLSMLSNVDPSPKVAIMLAASLSRVLEIAMAGLV